MRAQNNWDCIRDAVAVTPLQLRPYFYSMFHTHETACIVRASECVNIKLFYWQSSASLTVAMSLV